MNSHLLKPIIKNHRWELAFWVGCILLSSGFTLLAPLWTKHLIEEILPMQNLLKLGEHLAFGVSLMLMLQLSRFCRTFMKYKITNNFCWNIRNRLFEKMMNLPYLSMGEQSRGDLISRISNDIQVFREGMVNGIFVIIANMLTVVGLLLMMVWHSAHLSLMLLFILPLIAASTIYFNKKIRARTIDAQESLSFLNSLVEEAVCGFKEIKSYVNEKLVRKRFKKVNTDTLYSFNLQDRLMALGPAITTLIAFTGIAGLMFGAAWIMFHGALSPGDLTVFLTCLALMVTPIENLAQSFGFASRMEAALERFNDVTNMSEEEKDGSGLPDIVIKKGRISFDHVFYAYPQGFALTDIHFEVVPGETLAITGPSGGGKTTLINLIPLFFKPQQGAILIDGMDISKCNIFNLRRQIGFVSQEPILFDATLAENLAFAKPDASMAEIQQAARAANIHEFAVNLKNGYQTPVGRYAAHLSVGQRQRISIARALLADPKILIMDEPTSSLDSESEELIRQALSRLCLNRTTLIVAHRLSTIRYADRIISLDKGKIVEQGTHQELIGKGGLYSRLYSYNVSNEGKTMVN